MSTITDIADAVTAALNGHEFTQTFTAERVYEPVSELSELSDLKVSVVPRTLAMTRADRAGDFWDVDVDVAIQKSAATTAVRDALMVLAEDVLLFLRSAGPVGGATWMSAESDPIWVPDQLREHGVMTIVLTMTYRLKR